MAWPRNDESRNNEAMNVSITMTVLVAAYVAASVGYVYRWRGRVRYRSFSQYLRKSWPIFAPANCLLYLATRSSARQTMLDAGYVQGISIIRENWKLIRDEALALHRAGELDATAQPGSVGYHDVGFRTFYKRGWRKFYLTWYGEPHRSALRLCPETVRLLGQAPGIRAAMFSVLPAGSELTLHSDPMACSLRYHLGLQTPDSDRCFISVDGCRRAWRNGEDFVFDETYPHYAKNETGELRLILMCDVDRPMSFMGHAFNRLYSLVPKAMRVPNTREDRRGPISWLFAVVAPVRSSAVALKQQHRKLYLSLKYSLNTCLVLLAFLLVYVMLDSVERVGTAALF